MTNTTEYSAWVGAAARGVIAFMLALGPALTLTPAAAHAAPPLAGRAAPTLRPLADTPQGSPFTVNNFADSTDGECGVAHCTLREAVIAANALPGADAITLLAGTYVLDLVGADEDAAATGDLDLTGDLTLTGVTSATTLISGTAAAFGDRLFEITSTATVSMSNVGLTGGHVSGDGGGLRNWGTLTLSDTRVISNSADFGGGLRNLGVLTMTGGAVLSNTATDAGGGLSNYWIVSITGTLIAHNQAGMFGGGLSSYHGDSAVALSQASLDHVTLSSNSAQFGGAIMTGGALTVTDSLIDGNTASSYGGGVFQDVPYPYTPVYTVLISGTTFSHNSAIYGGGLVNPIRQMELIATNFISNTAAEGGGVLNGGLFTGPLAPTPVLTISGGLFEDNFAYVGGAVFNSYNGVAMITDTAVISNSGIASGFYNAGQLTLMDSVVSGNASNGLVNEISGTVAISASLFERNQGSAIGNSGALTVTNSSFLSNTTPTNGGGLYTTGPATVYSSTFTGNTAGTSGGGLYAQGPITATLTDSLVVSNSAIEGGGVFGDTQTHWVITNTHVLSNSAGTPGGGGGGGLLTAGSLWLANSLVAHNEAGYEGGGVTTGTPATIISTTVMDNHAHNPDLETLGGGLEIVGDGLALVQASLIVSNTADWGGGLYAERTELTVLSTTIAGNSADFGGGIANFAHLSLIGGAVLSNTAEGGGGLNNFAVATITGTTFAGNAATYIGGGVVNYAALPGELSALTVAGASFISNTADLGGGLYNSGHLTLTTSLFAGNAIIDTQFGSGGGLANTSAGLDQLPFTALISDTTFQHNTATDDGGGLVNFDRSLELVNVNFISNTAHSGGGLANGKTEWSALFTATAYMTITGGLFEDNLAAGAGGGLANLIESRLVVRGSDFVSNTSLFAGGGLTNQGVLDMQDSTVTRNYAAFDGGGLASGSTLTLTRVLIAENHADVYAGGLFVTGPTYPHALIQDSRILTNTAPSGGGLYAEEVELQVLTTTIAGNSADLYGGGIAVGRGALTLTTVTFISNTADLGGGLALGVDVFTGYPISATAGISGSVFTGNTAEHWGGGLYSSISGTLTIRQTQFMGNWANERGGGLATEGYAAIANSHFISNTASDGFVGFGGGLAALIRGVIVLTDSLLLGNTARVYGGGVYGGNLNSDGGFGPGQTTLSVTNTQFLSNTADSGGGLAALGALWLADSLVAYNVVTDFGGGVAAASSSATITNTTIADNQAANAAGGLYLEAMGPALVQNSRILSNTSDRGGGIFLGRNGPTQIIGSQILSNTATAYGGGLVSGGAAVQVLTTTIAANSAGTQGGGVFANVALTLTNVTLFSNLAGGDGGGLAAVSLFGSLPNVLLNNVSVVSNTATGDGGGLYSDITGTVAISLSQFTSNTADNDGGGLFTLGAATVYSSTFTGNTAANNGGGLSSGPPDSETNEPGTRPLTIDASTFVSNTASENRGGGLYVHNPVTLTNSLILSNTSPDGGGLFSFTDSLVVIRNSTFSGNISGQGGGLSGEGRLDIQDSVFTHNQATFVGGGINSQQILTLTRVLVAENSAGMQGGGLYVSGFNWPDAYTSPNLIRNSAILSNTAAEGGGLYSVGDYVRVLTSTIAGNTATGRGGGLYAANAVTLTNVTLSGNQAGSDGGGLAAVSWTFIQFGYPVGFTATVLLNNVSVVSNTTTGGDGGGVFTSISSTVRVTNTLIAGNLDSGSQAPDCAGPLISGGYNLIGSTTGCTLTGSLTGVLSNTAALLGPLADNGGGTLTHALLPGSPAQDAGNPAAPGSSDSACAPADQRGVPRPFGPRCDLGAYEATSAPPTPTVQFSTAAYTTAEAATVLPFTATLSAASSLTVTVTYSTTPGNATAGADYVAATGVLTFAPGITSTTGTLTLLPDALDEPDESFGVILTSPTNATLGAPASASVTITDDDAPPSVQWSTSVYTVTEGVGSLTLTAKLSSAAAVTVTVSYSTTPGSALAGSDYLAANGVITFAPGVTTQTVSIGLSDDTEVEAEESFSVSLSSPTNATLGVPPSATVTITDSDNYRQYIPFVWG